MAIIYEKSYFEPKFKYECKLLNIVVASNYCIQRSRVINELMNNRAPSNVLATKNLTISDHIIKNNRIIISLILYHM